MFPTRQDCAAIRVQGLDGEEQTVSNNGSENQVHADLAAEWQQLCGFGTKRFRQEVPTHDDINDCVGELHTTGYSLVLGSLIYC